MPSGPGSTNRLSTSTGRIPRTSSKGGRQKSNVVSSPVPSPASTERQGNSSVIRTGKQLSKDRRQRFHHAHPGGHSEQASGQSQAQCLKQKDAQQVR